MCSSDLAFSAYVSVLFAGTNWLLSPITLSFFTDNINIIELGKKVMFVAFCLEFGRTSNIVIIQSMRAAGDVVFPTVLGICSMWGISVLFAYLLGLHFGLGLVGVWVAMASDEIIRGIVVFIRWIKGSWKGKRISQDS